MPQKFLMVPSLYQYDYHRVGNWWMSERLNSFQFIWDGGISRDVNLADVPWANNHRRDGKRKTRVNSNATGLWSGNGNPICAPEWFLDLLPNSFLSGDLWSNVDNYHTFCYSVAINPVPIDTDWEKVQLACYSLPPAHQFFTQRNIFETNFKRRINYNSCVSFFSDYTAADGEGFLYLKDGAIFDTELLMMKQIISDNPVAFIVPHTKLDASHIRAAAQVAVKLKTNPSKSIVIRSPQSVWKPTISSTCLYYDGEL